MVQVVAVVAAVVIRAWSELEVSVELKLQKMMDCYDHWELRYLFYLYVMFSSL